MDSILKLRQTTCSPAEELSLRPGQVEPIPDSVAALILCLKGTAEIGLKGIVVRRVELGPDPIFFHHPDSIVLNDLSSAPRSFSYALNRLDPSMIHLFDPAGRYVESIPRTIMPAALDKPALSRAIADKKRTISRLSKHLDRLHGIGGAAELAALEATSSEMFRVVQALPASHSPSVPSAPSVLPADRAMAAHRNHNLATAERDATRADLLSHFSDRHSLAPAATAPDPDAPFNPYET